MSKKCKFVLQGIKDPRKRYFWIDRTLGIMQGALLEIIMPVKIKWDNHFSWQIETY